MKRSFIFRTWFLVLVCLVIGFGVAAVGTTFQRTCVDALVGESVLRCTSFVKAVMYPNQLIHDSSALRTFGLLFVGGVLFSLAVLLAGRKYIRAQYTTGTSK